MSRTREFSLPLLAKEMVEMAVRPRTYQVRVAYAGLLMLISCIVLYVTVPFSATSPLSVLGSGAQVMAAVSFMQNWGLLLVLPAVACGVFTIEKERNTLCLLFLTRLGPWTIVFEKLMSRLVLAFSFLAISLPLISLCYSLGGVTSENLLSELLSLLIWSVLIISIGVFCSAYFRTTPAALIGTYAALFATRFVVFGIVMSLFGVLRWDLWWIMTFSAAGEYGPIATAGSGQLQTVVMFSGIWLFVSLIYILLARWCLISRAFLAPRNPLKEFFKRLDGMFERANKSLTRGIIVIKPAVRLPDDQPIAWRELSTRSIGQARYLIRILLVLEVPLLLFLCRFLILGEMRAVEFTTFTVQILMWLAMTLVVCVLSASLISGERGRQSLDVLLTTPISAPEIVRQKLSGIWRLIWIFEVPIWTCLAFRFLVDWSVPYVVCHAVMLVIYPRIVAWASMSYGLRSKTAIIAVVKSLLAVAWRCLGPLLLIYLLAMMLFFRSGPGKSTEELLAFFVNFSPLMLFFTSEMFKENLSDVPFGISLPGSLILTVVIQGGFWWWAKFWCLERAEVLLGRKQNDVPVLQRLLPRYES